MKSTDLVYSIHRKTELREKLTDIVVSVGCVCVCVKLVLHHICAIDILIDDTTLALEYAIDSVLDPQVPQVVVPKVCGLGPLEGKR